LILPETIGNATALTAGNRTSALCLEESDRFGHTGPVEPAGYGSDWPEDQLSIIWRNIISKERGSHREDKKKPAMSPKEKKAARKESGDLPGEHGVR
jgi:hypothetical protein